MAAIESELLIRSERDTMNFLKRIAGKFTARGRALAKVELGMDCANRQESDNATQLYADVINSSESPRKVKAMAVFNRALVYTTIGKERQASEDLKAVLRMAVTLTKIKKYGSDKLVRMRRKVEHAEQLEKAAFVVDLGGDA